MKPCYIMAGDKAVRCTLNIPVTSPSLIEEKYGVQLYGPVRQAPELSGASPRPEHAASSQQLATSQQLAYCLATPFTGELWLLPVVQTNPVLMIALCCVCATLL